LKLMAFLDGELAEKDARDVASWVARDTEARDLLAEFRNTRKALAGFEPGLKVPEAREFYWSKVQRRIESLEPAPLGAPAPAPVLAFLRRLLVPGAALAAAVLLLGLFGLRFGKTGGEDSVGTEMTSADSGTFTYKDETSGTTLVWVSYPAETEFARPEVH
jgi:anti-sigma factor RsiW